ncbi:sodium:solute symporter family protein [Lipingzhangella sp. LS1_29]|uniref:Sodium:solute symporter family protein n=1 Tax=Lipingzhangella rawalii TaxID=2055835 RepID=A0ABU2H167_9ACTN|nr:sodium:solute symporter family protein [Lipingzhangella rawalii]MDS1269039.1 sodium:solute symporter family protein [Lipingzhangella rawalii]
MQAVHLSILAGYLLVMVAIAVAITRRGKIKSGDDFMFAGRSLSRPVLVGTLLATWVGSGTIVGGANFVYSHGPLAGMIFFAGGPVGILVLYLIARRVRRASRYTLPELLEVRFGSGVRTAAALVTILAYLGIAASQFMGGGYVLSLITPLDATEATILVAVIVTLLTISGGLFSVAYTDFLSTLVIVGALIVSVPVVFAAVGGVDAYWSELPQQATTVTGGLSWIQLLGFFLPTLLLILADQNMYQRLTAAKDENQARSAALGMFGASFAVYIPVTLLASAAMILLPQIDADMAILGLAAEGHVPVLIGGLILACAAAFVITTGSSYMLSCASNLTYDLYARFLRSDSTDAQRLRVQRGAVLAVAVIAFVLGMFFPTVLDLQLYSYTVYGAAMVPTVFAVLFWKRATPAGAFAALIAGAVTTVLWQLGGSSVEAALGVDEIEGVLVALPIAVVAMVAVSLLTRPRQTEPSEELHHQPST